MNASKSDSYICLIKHSDIAHPIADSDNFGKSFFA